MLSLDAYFERIGWGRPTTPTYETLAGLLAAHMRAIPFENLDVLAGRGIDLSIERVAAKLVGARRGGYCFEHATLFAEVLDRLGFHVERHSARVTLVLPREKSPRGHMFLTVILAGRHYVVDPGLGGPASTEPVEVVDVGADVGRQSHWLARDGALWALTTRVDDVPRQVWVSTLEIDHSIDFEAGSHFMATHPASPFRQRLFLNRFTAEGRVSVMNRCATSHSNGRVHTEMIASRAALGERLIRDFEIDFPALAELKLPFIPEWA